MSLDDDGELGESDDSSSTEVIKGKRKKKDTAPSVSGCLWQQFIIAFIGLIAALLSFLAVSNPLVTVTFESICNNIINFDGTPIGPLPTDTPIATQTLAPTVQPTNTLSPTLTPMELPTSTPSTAVQRFFPLPLVDGVFWPEGYNVGQRVANNGVDERTFFEIPFEVGRQINTPGCPNSTHTDEYILEANISRPIAVYFLIQAGQGFSRYENNQIGRIELVFSDGSVVTQELTLGFNVRDWARDKDPGVAVQTVMDETVREAWRGSAGDPDTGWIGGVDMLTLPIPLDFQNSTISQIILRDMTIENIGLNEPCLHLQAVTVEARS